MGAPTLTGDFSTGRSEKRLGFIRWALGISLGIYPGAALDIAWDLSCGRSGNRLGFFLWPLRRSPSIFGIALGVSEHVPRHFPFKIPGDLDIRSKAMERHVEHIGGIGAAAVGHDVSVGILDPYAHRRYHSDCRPGSCVQDALLAICGYVGGVHLYLRVPW